MRLKHPTLAQQAAVEGECALLRDYLDEVTPQILRALLVDRKAAMLVRAAVADISTRLDSLPLMALRVCAWDELLAEALGE